MKAKHKLSYPVLNDAGNAYAKRLGLVHGFPEDLKEVYTNFGIAIPPFNGDDSWTLPLPTRIVLDREGLVRAIDADPDYTVRPEAEASLQVVRGLVGA